MTNSNPPDPSPHESPDTDAGGSPQRAQNPPSDSTSMHSDSAQTEQSPPPSNSRIGVYVAIAVVVVLVLLMVFGVIFGVL